MADTRTQRYTQDATRSRERDRGRGRGAMVQYYDELGYSTTEQGYESFQKYDKGWQADLNKQKGQLNQAQSQVNQAKSAAAAERARIAAGQSEINRYRSELDKARSQISGSNLSSLTQKAYDEAKSRGNLVKVNVVAGSDNRTEGSYWVPRETAEKIAGGIQYSNKANGQYYMHVKSQGRTIGGELHAGLSQAQRSAETSLKSQAQQEIASYMQQQQGVLNQNASQIGQAQSQINAAKGNLIQEQGKIERYQAQVQENFKLLNGLSTQKKEFIENLGVEYEKKIDTMERIMRGLSTEAGTSDTEGGILAQVQNGPTLTEQVIAGENIPVAQADVPNPEADVAAAVNNEEAK